MKWENEDTKDRLDTIEENRLNINEKRRKKRERENNEYSDRMVNYIPVIEKNTEYSLIAERVNEKRKGQINGFLDSTIRWKRTT